MDEEIVEIVLESGEKVEGEVLFTFEANGDNFVMYAINDEAFGGKIDEEGAIKPLEEDEWKIVEPLFKEYMENEEYDN